MKTFELTGLNKKGVKVVLSVTAASDRAARALVKNKIKTITMVRIIDAPVVEEETDKEAVVA